MWWQTTLPEEVPVCFFKNFGQIIYRTSDCKLFWTIAMVATGGVDFLFFLLLGFFFILGKKTQNKRGKKKKKTHFAVNTIHRWCSASYFNIELHFCGLIFLI